MQSWNNSTVQLGKRVAAYATFLDEAIAHIRDSLYEFERDCEGLDRQSFFDSWFPGFGAKCDLMVIKSAEFANNLRNCIDNEKKNIKEAYFRTQFDCIFDSGIKLLEQYRITAEQYRALGQALRPKVI